MSENNSVAKEVFRDPRANLHERVEDLLSRLTLEEKVSQMTHESPPIARLGIPAYNWWSECLHGVARAGVATVFPQAIALAASWNRALLKEVAAITATEARAKHHEFSRQGDYSEYKGLTYWSPNINIVRDPRWGRTQETYGEDPYLTGELAVAFVRGLQGDHPHYLKVVATPKHFAVHSGPESKRHELDVLVNNKDLRETYLPAFRAAVEEGKAASIMGAYNRVNGEPCCASDMLMRRILREEWGFQGYYVSDCGAICDFHLNHKITNRPAESAAMAVRLGCDLNCGKVYPNLLQALEDELISEEEIDVCLRRLLEAKFRLGMFDPPDDVPYAQIPYEVVDSAEHRAAALRAARESIVLLKNEGKLLPLSKDIASIAVIGPNADDRLVLLGNYYGTPSHATTILEGIREAVSPATRLWYAEGCPVASTNILGVTQPDTHGLSEALSAAQRADVVILVLGNAPCLEGEEGEVDEDAGGGDRSTLDLPYVQQHLMEHLHAAGKPTVLVLTGGSPISATWAAEHIQAILMGWYPGEEGGAAIAEVIFGDYSPAGRLPMTFPESVDDLPPFEDYSMQGRTYRYLHTEPLYPFGYGLSYTEFSYTNLNCSAPELAPGMSLEVSVEVQNTGHVSSDEVVQCYIRHKGAGQRVPNWQLAGFQRLHLRAGESRRVTVPVSPEQIQIFTEEGIPHFPKGSVVIAMGGMLPDQNGREEDSVLFAEIPLVSQPFLGAVR